MSFNGSPFLIHVYNFRLQVGQNLRGDRIRIKGSQGLRPVGMQGPESGPLGDKVLKGNEMTSTGAIDSRGQDILICIKAMVIITFLGGEKFLHGEEGEHQPPWLWACSECVYLTPFRGQVPASIGPLAMV